MLLKSIEHFYMHLPDLILIGNGRIFLYIPVLPFLELCAAEVAKIFFD